MLITSRLSRWCCECTVCLDVCSLWITCETSNTQHTFPFCLPASLFLCYHYLTLWAPSPTLTITRRNPTSSPLLARLALPPLAQHYFSPFSTAQDILRKPKEELHFKNRTSKQSHLTQVHPHCSVIFYFANKFPPAFWHCKECTLWLGRKCHAFRATGSLQIKVSTEQWDILVHSLASTTNDLVVSVLSVSLPATT